MARRAIDEFGGLDPAALQEELRRALEEDFKRKAEDSMKKRAIHVAKSYDDFKGMVACSTLKPIT
jgi:hypothetical protein